MNLEGLNKTVPNFLWQFSLWLLCCCLCLSSSCKYPYFLGNQFLDFSSCSVPPLFTYPGLSHLYSLTSHPTPRLTFAVSFSASSSVTYCSSPFHRPASPTLFLILGTRITSHPSLQHKGHPWLLLLPLLFSPI